MRQRESRAWRRGRGEGMAQEERRGHGAGGKGEWRGSNRLWTRLGGEGKAIRDKGGGKRR